MGCRSAVCLTTGNLARLWSVAPRTVCSWVDSRILRGYRLPHGGHDRRVHLSEAIDFSRRHGLPMEELHRIARQRGMSVGGSLSPVLLVTSTTDGYADVIDHPRFDVTMRDHILDASTVYLQRTWDAVLLDCSIGSADVRAFLRWSSDDDASTRFGVVINDDDTIKGWKGLSTWKRPFDALEAVKDLVTSNLQGDAK